MKNHKLEALLATIFLGLSISLGCSHSSEAPQPAASPESSAPVVPPALTAKGVVESQEKAELSSRVSGTITSILVDEGKTTTQGEVLCLLDDSKIVAKMKLDQAAIEEATAHWAELKAGTRLEEIDRARSEVKRVKAMQHQAETEYDRQKRLYEKNATTLVELEKAEEKAKETSGALGEVNFELEKLQHGSRKEEIEQARAMLEKAEAELNYDRTLLRDYTITSPMNGLVTDKLKNVGETVDVGIPILRLINPHKLRIRAELEEGDVGKVKVGQSATVYSAEDVHLDKPFVGEVYQVLPALKRKSIRNFDPLASYDVNSENIYVRLKDWSALKSGMSVLVRFEK